MSVVATSRRARSAGPPLSIALAVLSIGLLRVRFSGGPDASFYLGHVVDLSGQAARFGQTYHGNRISYILVDRWFVATFGLEPGLLLARHVVLAAAILASYRIGLRWAGAPGGVLAAGSIAFVPWLPRELLWTFYDGFAVTYLLVAAAALLVPVGPRARAVGEVAAGVLLAAAINANLVLAAIATVTVLSALAARPHDGPRRALLGLGRILVGWATMTAVFALLLRALYPGGEPFPDLVALRVGLEVLATTQYFTPLRELGWRLGHLAPTLAVAFSLLVLMAGAGGGTVESRPLVRAAAVHVGGVAALALTLHLVTKDTWFNAAYYTIYHLPGTVIGLVAIVAAVGRRRPERGLSLVAAVTLVIGMAGVYALLPLPESFVHPVAAVGVLGAIVAPVLAGGRRWSVTLVASMFALSGLGFASSLWHAGDLRERDSVASRNAAEFDLIEHQVALKALVEDHVAADERLQFWHTTQGIDGRDLTRLNMVFYGRGEGRVHAKDGPGMPTLSEGELTSLRSDPPVVVLMATDPSELTVAEVVLQLAGFGSTLRAAVQLDGEVVDVSIRILELALDRG